MFFIKHAQVFCKALVVFIKNMSIFARIENLTDRINICRKKLLFSTLAHKPRSLSAAVYAS